MRSKEARTEIGQMAMRVKQAVTETMRQTCGRTTGRRWKMERSLSALWYSVVMHKDIEKRDTLDGREEMGGA